MPQTYHLQNIRTLLTEGFSEGELQDFCFVTPEFRPVHHVVTGLTGKTTVIRYLLEFAHSKMLLDPLLAWAEQCSPARYQQHRPYFDGDTAPTPDEVAAVRTRYVKLIINRHQDLK
jgi:hypothetical protein